jgi:putative ABC transport system ATP-binding protein
MAVIATKDLKKTYITGEVKVEALRGITVEIEEGDFASFAGPSGSGKTTLLNLIGGLDNITSGEVFLDGTRINDLKQSTLSEIRLKKISYIFQQYNLIPVLSAYENIEYPLLLAGIKSEERSSRIRKSLENVYIKELAERKPQDMSGGQQQRVAIARALAVNPKIVLADEPTANLDSKNSSALIDLMHELNEKHKVTFVFSTHDPMVMEKSRRLILLKDGMIESDQRKR